MRSMELNSCFREIYVALCVIALTSLQNQFKTEIQSRTIDLKQYPKRGHKLKFQIVYKTNYTNYLEEGELSCKFVELWLPSETLIFRGEG